VKIEVNKAEFSKSNKKFVDFDTIVEMEKEVKPFFSVKAKD
jgi:hypothetical protein